MPGHRTGFAQILTAVRWEGRGEKGEGIKKYKLVVPALVGVAHRVGHHPKKQRVVGSVPSWGT